jgi:hypothetical protein
MLIVALMVDAAANIARLVSVEIAYHRQEKLIGRGEMETNKRIDAAANVIHDTVVATISELYNHADSEAKK